MKVEVRGDAVPFTPAVEHTLETKCRLVFGRVIAQVSTVRIVLRHGYGPHERHEVTCSVDVRMRRGAEIHTEATDVTMMSAADAALDRAARSAQRALARRHELRRDNVRIPLIEATY